MTADRPVGGTLMLRSDHDAEVARLEHRLRLVSDDRDQLAQLLGQALVEHYEALEAKNMHKERAEQAVARLARVGAAGRAETTTEWGVRWRPDDYEAAPDEDTARLWAASDTGHPVALVRREVTEWVEVGPDE